MEEINRQVRRVQRILIGQQFLSIVLWSLFATLLIGAIGLGIPKIWALPLNHDVWNYAWLGGSFGVGLMVALVWTYSVRRSAIDAAIELDRRFGLKERVSSTLALNQAELASEIGKALVIDALRKVERVDVRERFRIQPTWRFALPLVPAAVITGLLFVPNASLEHKAAAMTQDSDVMKKAIQQQIDKLKERARNKAGKSETATDLQTEQTLREIRQEFEDLANGKKTQRKEVQIKIHDRIKDIEKRQQEFGGAKEMQQRLDKLGKIEKGPAEKLAAAMKEGDFRKAQEQLNQLQADLQAGKLNDKDKEHVARQMEQMKDQIKQLAEDAKNARQKLEQEITKKLAQGDEAGAQKLQDKLDQMNKQGKPAENMLNQLAEKMGEAANEMKAGGNKDPQEAGKKLDELANALKDAQGQLDQLEKLDDLLDQLADAKNALNGKEGNKGKAGEGDLAGDNPGQGNKANKNGPPGSGNGSGRGEGKRGENEVETNPYISNVEGNVKKGEGTRSDTAGGPNQRVPSQQSVKAEIEAAASKDADPLTTQNLPREQRNHSDQYFELFRNGKK